MTPLNKIDQIYLKREDQNITGSAKDRSISLQLETLIKQNYKEAVISSTGNAAISAQYFCNKFNIPLKIFVSPKTNPKKLELLKNYTTSLKPISDAFKYAKINNAYLLRQSTDPTSIFGYSEIGNEILKQLPQVTSVFVPCGSGTTALGIAASIKNVWIVQPASHCPLASHYDKNYIPESETITDALGAKLLPLKNQIFKEIKYGAVVQNQQVKEAQEFLSSHYIDTSPEGALALAGYFKFIKDAGSFPVILLTGAKR
jgi:threonine dehydratase